MLRVGIVCRISGCQNQQELSLDDQEDNAKEAVAEVYEGPAEYDVIATKGKGENLERPELEVIEGAYRSREYDLFVYDDLSRLIRGGEAARLLGVGVDHGTRTICINDGIDTNSETWEEDALNACSENVAHCQRTSKRIKQKTMNRFKKLGFTARRPISGYIVPEGAKSYDAWQRDLKWEETIHAGAALLRETSSGAAVAEFFRKESFPLGPLARNEEWDGTMALRYYRNPLLKGMPQRGKMTTVKKHGTGKRVSERNPDGPTFYSAPHLAFFEPTEFDDLIEIVAQANKRYRRKRVNGLDGRQSVPRNRTRFPGQHATCWYCGRHYVWGANGITGHLMCSGAREWKCWNSIGIDGRLATEQLERAILERVARLHGVNEQFQQMIRAVRDSGKRGVREEWVRLEAEERVLLDEKANLLRAIRQCGPHEELQAELDRMTGRGRELAVRRGRLNELSNRDIQLPDSTITLRDIIDADLHRHSVDSYELASLLRQLAPTFHVYLVRLCDGGHLLPRAKVNLDLVGSFADAALVPGLRELLQQELTLDLFTPPQRERIREKVVELSTDSDQRKISVQLPEPATQAAVSKALALQRRMCEMGLSSPYVLVDEPPADYPKLRRHNHSRYKFEMREGYQRSLI
jgi:hypothetical protein